MNGLIKVGENHLLNVSALAYVVYDDDDEGGVLMRLRFMDADQDELTVVGRKATELWEQLQTNLLDM